LHAIVVGASTDKPPVPVPIQGDGVDGVAVDAEAYVFASAGPQKAPAAVSYKAPQGATRHFVTGLAPGATYGVSASADGRACNVAIRPGAGAAASAAGVLALSVSASCALTR
jgi:hypothetical protein